MSLRIPSKLLKGDLGDLQSDESLGVGVGAGVGAGVIKDGWKFLWKWRFYMVLNGFPLVFLYFSHFATTIFLWFSKDNN